MDGQNLLTDFRGPGRVLAPIVKCDLDWVFISLFGDMIFPTV